MSYSRWSNSRWYTFWSSIGSETTECKFPTKKLKRSQTFEICDLPSYFITYGDIEDKSMDQILKEVKETFIDNNPPTLEELKELEGYLLRFKEDVDEYFTLGTFIKYELWYSMRNTLLRKIKKLKEFIK